MSINAVFVFYKLSIFLLHKEVKKTSTIETALTCSRHLVKYTLKGDTKMNPFTPKTDHYLNSPHSIKYTTIKWSIRRACMKGRCFMNIQS